MTGSLEYPDNVKRRAITWDWIAGWLVLVLFTCVLFTIYCFKDFEVENSKEREKNKYKIWIMQLKGTLKEYETLEHEWI